MTVKRCKWASAITDPAYLEYHDSEWGTLVKDDRSLFELLCLEGAMAGLSWNTILKKRKYYIEEFANFDIEKVVKTSDTAGILARGNVVKHFGKIQV